MIDSIESFVKGTASGRKGKVILPERNETEWYCKTNENAKHKLILSFALIDIHSEKPDWIHTRTPLNVVFVVVVIVIVVVAYREQ